MPIDERGPRGRARRGVRVQGDRAHRRPPRLVRPRPRAAAARCCDLLRALSDVAARRHVPHQLAGADGLHAGHRRSRRRERRPVRAALPPAAAARQRPHAAADAASVHARRLPPPGRRHCRAPAARVDRNGLDRRVSRRDRRRLRRESGVPAVVAAVAPARVSLLGPSGHRGRRRCRTRWRGR